MANEIVVPDLGESIVEATVADWLKQEGESVKAGETVVILETDKVDLDVAATSDGVLARIDRKAGEDVKIGDVLGVVEASDGQPAPQAAPKAPAQPAASTPSEDGGAEHVTPVARRLAEEHGIDVAAVSASGPRGRVTKEDVQRYIDQSKSPRAPEKAPAPKPASAPAAPPPPERIAREERVRMTRRRRTIAERLVEAQRTAAMLTTFNEIDMSAVIDIRTRRKESFQKQHDIKLGFMSFFVKASVGALKAFPPLNAEIDGDEIVLKHYYDIGVAIGAPEGLVVPVLRDADRMSFAGIEREIDAFARKAKDGALSLDDLRGGTFTITNGGVFGSMMSTPILNPPQVAILGLHKIEQRPVVVNGEIVIRPMMYVAVSYDHRIVDGREAVQFLVRIKELIEDPETLLLEG
ncbi:MAG TPA: 2-oxoglutarate dehydrogenase complex dihydrolipoyllysine-residue succinyltransferase [Aggregatilinea sp.]|uniref:2-oxoglutarate dehydrogenase complex dihydrolipoyllysine-residue succinyltransferase n=1 Tax=Aggregatilinea sp. TaxID=2806333 RepID=UPI002CDFBA65|nr:2-oxoglutarate dehydrogenase complex dihydrolipoyllysine-residue succinyltransferase [Aggregatilinea sp.]HML23177.1 2-oxoglutarate dehydrogenase complex dihydrolipoyllysine-residue succinyltransferase [Aggregatilinea sp.]